MANRMVEAESGVFVGVYELYVRLHGKISARLAGIPAPRYRDLG